MRELRLVALIFSQCVYSQGIYVYLLCMFSKYLQSNNEQTLKRDLIFKKSTMAALYSSNIFSLYVVHW